MSAAVTQSPTQSNGRRRSPSPVPPPPLPLPALPTTTTTTTTNSVTPTATTASTAHIGAVGASASANANATTPSSGSEQAPKRRKQRFSVSRLKSCAACRRSHRKCVVLPSSVDGRCLGCVERQLSCSVHSARPAAEAPPAVVTVSDADLKEAERGPSAAIAMRSDLAQFVLKCGVGANARASGVILRCNEKFLELTGSALQNVIDQHPSTVMVPPADKRKRLCSLYANYLLPPGSLSINVVHRGVTLRGRGGGLLQSDLHVKLLNSALVSSTTSADSDRVENSGGANPQDTDSARQSSNAGAGDGGGAIDVGVWGIPQRVLDGKWPDFDGEQRTIELEAYTRSVGGVQCLYATTFQTEAEFKQMFAHEHYYKMRKKYGADKAFPEVFEKVRLRQK